MRKYLREIARRNMKKAGIKQINKKKSFTNPITKESEMRSYFSLHWREFVK